MSDHARMNPADSLEQPLSWPESVQVLRDARIECDEDLLLRVRTTDERGLCAALSFLWHRYTRPHHACPGVVPEGADGLDDRATMLIAGDDGARRGFVDRVMFDVSTPAMYESLARAVRWLVPVDRLTEAIVDRLTHGTDRQRANALHMQYYLFGRSGDVRLGAERWHRIATAVDALRARHDLGPETDAAIRGFRLPQDPIVR